MPVRFAVCASFPMQPIPASFLLISQRIKISIPPKRAIRPILYRIVRFCRFTRLLEILAGSGLALSLISRAQMRTAFPYITLVPELGVVLAKRQTQGLGGRYSLRPSLSFRNRRPSVQSHRGLRLSGSACFSAPISSIARQRSFFQLGSRARSRSR